MSDWISYVKSVQEELGCTYGEAMREASARRRANSDDSPDGSGPMWDAVKRHARGIADAVRGNRRNIKPSSRGVLEAVGDQPIERMAVARTPLKNSLNKIINFASKLRSPLHRGSRDEVPEQLFHLYIVVTLASGDQYVIEKNQHINIIPAPTAQLEAESMPVDLSNLRSQLSMNMMMDRAKRAVGSRLFDYSATDANCQRFVYDVLAANGIAISDPLREFILQPVENIIPHFARKLAYGATSLANRANLVVEGRGDARNTSCFFAPSRSPAFTRGEFSVSL